METKEPIFTCAVVFEAMADGKWRKRVPWTAKKGEEARRTGVVDDSR
jgi:hypothetical protein